MDEDCSGCKRLVRDGPYAVIESVGEKLKRGRVLCHATCSGFTQRATGRHCTAQKKERFEQGGKLGCYK